MKRVLLILAMVGSLAACKQEGQGSSSADEDSATKSAVTYYGEKFSADNAISGKELRVKMNNTAEMNVIVGGKVADVCKKEGCWLNLDMGDNTVMQVRMKDHAFMVPKDCDGKYAVIMGKAYMDTTSIEQLRHYAEDAGKPQAEIESINQPKVELVFEAKGVAL